MGNFQYDYILCTANHAADAQIARQLVASVAKYRLPKGVFSDAPTYNRMVADYTDAPLDDDMRAALEASRFMIVICSPATQGSANIEAKLQYFAGIRSKSNIVAVIASGEPFDAFPAFFIEQKQVQRTRADGTVETVTETVEPVASDLRGRTAGERRRALNYETVRVVATLVGLHPDVLARRHEKRRRQRFAAITAFAGSIFLVVAVIFGVLGASAAREGRMARTQAEMSAEMARRLFVELPVQFAAVPEALPYVTNAMLDGLDGLLARGDSQLDSGDLEQLLAATEQDSAVSLLRKGALWRRLGNSEAAAQIYQSGIGMSGMDSARTEQFVRVMGLLLADDANPAGYAQYLLHNGSANTALKDGDLLVAVNGTAFNSYGRYAELTSGALPDTEMTVRLLRENEQGTLESLEVTLNGVDLAGLLTVGV